MKRLLNYFSKFELALWTMSITAVTVFFCVFDRSNYMSLILAIIGATSLIFIAKGNPIGSALGVVFAVVYSIVSYSYAYYGEMFTNLGMMAPMGVWALIAWLKHPHNGNRAEVHIKNISKKEIFFMLGIAASLTVAFYFILRAFNTTNLVPSTISIAPSFCAVYLSARRSPYYAAAYAVNDIVLIVLWSLAVADSISYVCVLVCVCVFLVNDSYGFFNWRRMKKRQVSDATKNADE